MKYRQTVYVEQGYKGKVFCGTQHHKFTIGGIPYYVAISHAAKKLVRLIFALEQSGQAYQRAA